MAVPNIYGIPVTGGIAGNGTVTLTPPTGASGYLAIAQWYGLGAFPSELTVPSGWTLVEGGRTSDDFTNWGIWKSVPADSPGSVWGHTNGSFGAAIAVVGYNGPLTVHQSAGTDDSQIAPDVTTTEPSLVARILLQQHYGSAPTITYPSGYTVGQASLVYAAGGEWFTASIAHLSHASGAAGTATWSTSGGSMWYPRAQTLALTTTAVDAWWDAAWGARRKLTLDASTIGETLADFPVRISLTSANIDYTKTQNSGQDIRFVDSSGMPLKHEIETWNESGTSEVWVKVPQITGGSSTGYIYLYYDNASATDGQDAANVWDSNFKSVLHLDEAPANGVAGHDDSTANNHDATPQGFAGSAGSTTNASGRISGGDHFNTDNDHLEIADHADYTLSATGAYTWSAWINPDTFPNWSTVWAQTLDLDNHFFFYAHTVSSPGLPGGGITAGVSAWFYTGPSNYINADTINNALTAGAHQLVTVTYDGAQAQASRFKIYVNGVDVTSGAAVVSGTLGNLDPTSVWVGGNQPYGEHFDGVIDEVRYHTTLRSAEWIKADYLSTSNTLVAFGSEEVNSGSSPANPAAFFRLFD